MSKVSINIEGEMPLFESVENRSIYFLKDFYKIIDVLAEHQEGQEKQTLLKLNCIAKAVKAEEADRNNEIQKFLKIFGTSEDLGKCI